MILYSVDRYASVRAIFYCAWILWTVPHSLLVFFVNFRSKCASREKDKGSYMRRVKCMRGDEVQLHSLTTRSGTELFCIWFKFVFFLLLRLGLPSVFFPYYTISTDDVFATFTSAGIGQSFVLKGMVGILVTKWRTDELKLCHQGRSRRNPEIALISVWKVSYWPWLGEVEIWMCSDTHQSSGLHAFKIFRQFRFREQ